MMRTPGTTRQVLPRECGRTARDHRRRVQCVIGVGRWTRAVLRNGSREGSVPPSTRPSGDEGQSGRRIGHARHGHAIAGGGVRSPTAGAGSERRDPDEPSAVVAERGASCSGSGGRSRTGWRWPVPQVEVRRTVRPRSRGSIRVTPITEIYYRGVTPRAMADWSLRDTLGIVIVLAATLSAARAVDGIAQALIVLVGVVIALLWIGNFVLRGYTDTLRTPETDN